MKALKMLIKDLSTDISKRDQIASILRSFTKPSENSSIRFYVALLVSVAVILLILLACNRKKFR